MLVKRSRGHELLAKSIVCGFIPTNSSIFVSPTPVASSGSSCLAAHVPLVCSSRPPTTPRACNSSSSSATRYPDAPKNAKSAAAMPEFSAQVNAVRGKDAPALQGTLVLAVPGTPPHLVDAAPLAHPLDGDGYLMAVSFTSSDMATTDGSSQADDVWARGRFVRTKAYYRERRLRKRVYRGQYGTPGITGLAAPLQPKKTSNAGVFVWGTGRKRKVLAFGDRGLPMSIDLATLATKGSTALGTALTDLPELGDSRGGEVSVDPVVTTRGTLAVCARARGPTGRVTGLYICEIDDQFEKVATSQKIPIPTNAHIAAFGVSESHYIVFLYSIVEPSRSSSNPLLSLLGRADAKSSSSIIDSEYGTLVLLVPITAGSGSSASDGADSASTQPMTFQLPNVFVTSCIHPLSRTSDVAPEATSLSLDLSVLEGGTGLSVSQLADALSGRARGPSGLRGSLRRCVVSVPSSADDEGVKVAGRNPVVVSMTDLGERSPHLSFLSPATGLFPATGGRLIVSSATDESSGSCGVAVLDTMTGQTSYWGAAHQQTGAMISRPHLTGDGKRAIVLVSGQVDGMPSRVAVLDISNVAAGPEIVVPLDAVQLGASTGGVWCDDVFSWSEHGQKLPASSYEMFEDKNWNDINSGFSSLGLNQ